MLIFVAVYALILNVNIYIVASQNFGMYCLAKEKMIVSTSPP